MSRDRIEWLVMTLVILFTDLLLQLAARAAAAAAEPAEPELSDRAAADLDRELRS